jgi:hypothetical protein
VNQSRFLGAGCIISLKYFLLNPEGKSSKNTAMVLSGTLLIPSFIILFLLYSSNEV